MNIWFATGNEHKKQELAAILSPHRIRTPAEAGYDFDPDETGTTFLENALIKARELYALVKEPVVSDDSGLCVDALGGRPGVLSARYGSENGKKLSSEERNELLLSQIGDAEHRGARFVCAMVLMLSPDRFFVAQETLEGVIVRKGRGSGGFGYDPVLYLPEYGKTVAELDEAEKNALSHRGKAGLRIASILTTL
jgi:XTP/dITP diphosphohydrolase